MSVANFLENAILRTGMELVFLSKDNFDFIDEFDDVFEVFSINNKGINILKETISNMYKLLGSEGFYTRFNIDISEFDKDNNFIEFEYDEEDLQETDEKMDLFIDKSKFIEKGQSETIKNKIIHIKNTVYVKGELLFENCEIHFENDLLGIAVTVTEDGGIGFNNCIVTTDKPCVSCAIFLEDARLYCNNSVFRNCMKFAKYEYTAVTANNCRFENCSESMFIGESSDKGNNNIEFEKCVVNGNLGNFISDKSGNATQFKECGFLSNNSLNETNHFEQKDYLIYVSKGEFTDCYFEGNNGKNDIQVIKESSYEGQIVLDKCIFKNIKCCAEQEYKDDKMGSNIIDFSKVKLQNCEFYNTTGLGSGEVEITNCKFIECFGILISCSTGKINNCSFEKCMSKNGETWGCIIEVNNYTESQSCKILNCVFISCDTAPREKGYWFPDSIIRIRGTYKKSLSRADIESCLFKNCTTGTGTIIDGTEKEKKIMGPKEKNYAYISECNYVGCKKSS